MKKVYLPQTTNSIHLNEINPDEPIFARLDGKLSGMVVEEDRGWILRIGGNNGSSGYHKTLLECLQKSASFGYEFYVV